MKVLFICTHNRCRSVLAEAITNHVAKDRITAKSAGSQPVGQVHPLSLKYLDEKGISIEGLRSQSWDEHEAFAPDVVFTVCDSAAAEACPVWFGDSIQVHWGLSDPSKLDDDEAAVKQAFLKTMGIIENRIKALISKDFESMDKETLKLELTRLREAS